MGMWVGALFLKCKVSGRQFCVAGKCALLCNASAVANADRICPLEAADDFPYS